MKAAEEYAATVPAKQRRRQQRGWYFYDWANSVFPTTVLTVFLGPYLTSVTRTAAGADGLVHPLGIPVTAGSFFPYVVSAATVIQVLVLPITGTIADRSAHKRELLAALAYAGALCTALMFFLAGDRYLLGGILFLLGNTALGASVVVYNSFLNDIATVDERDRVSSRGWAFGYLGGALLLGLNLALFLGHDRLGIGEGDAVRICLLSAGIWWAAFTVIPLRTLRNRRPVHVERGRPLSAGFRQLGRTIASLRHQPRTLLFLAAFLLYNDGIQTVISLASVYGSEELELGQSVLISTILLVQFMAFVGALLLGKLAQLFGTKRVVLASLVLWTAVVVVAYFLETGAATQFYLLGAAIAIVLGGSQALSRSLFSLLIPRGREAEFFGFYEISDKGTSWIGPLVFGLALQVTGSYRSAIVSLVVFFVVGFVLLAATNLPRAVREAGNPVPDKI
ncbi:MAG: MFS transporter [Streptosporangiales bacterium]|nr:MFS transporter [Streptosporangiales bacterium]